MTDLVTRYYIRWTNEANWERVEARLKDGHIRLEYQAAGTGSQREIPPDLLEKTLADLVDNACQSVGSTLERIHGGDRLDPPLEHDN